VIGPSLDSTVTSLGRPHLDSNVSASAKLSDSISLAMYPGFDGAARAEVLFSEDPSLSALSVGVETCNSTSHVGAPSNVFSLRMDGVPAAEISGLAAKKFTGWTMKLCQLWNAPQLVSQHLMNGPSEPSDPWEEFHLDTIYRFYNDDDFESDYSWERTPPEPVSHDQFSNASCDNPSLIRAEITTPPGFDYEAAVRQLLQDIWAAGLAQPAEHHPSVPLALPSPWALNSSRLLHEAHRAPADAELSIQPRAIDFSQESTQPWSTNPGNNTRSSSQSCYNLQHPDLSSTQSIFGSQHEHRTEKARSTLQLLAPNCS